MSDYVEKMLMKSEGQAAEALSLQRMKTTRSSGKPSKKSGFSKVLLQVLSFFPLIIFPSLSHIPNTMWCGVVVVCISMYAFSCSFEFLLCVKSVCVYVSTRQA